ncbi:efflux transporter outer membrane subunit [Pedobacter duraquae]|uniref:NodT family efflux transporter outer membrane factor (OMF) lipoprotein n=1 Tax=Pedobacter duraquae TaxID=425511 RepID=A0A4R6IR06_9SPHI|nr:efflux transporter outer membrane subunit [Pedobacter duraquae]TDO24799.1 NodT family efflux transporter outer membrane factor (OMF) lipoprotein [Pedobacter duraquae]
MKTYIKFIPVLLLLILSACKVSKDLSAPVTATPAQFRDVTSTDSTSIATFPWKEFFTDPAISTLIDSALVKNYDLQIALKNMESSALLYSQSKAGNIPSLFLNVTANTSRPSDNSLNGLSTSTFLNTTHIEDYNANLSLSWEADIWGKIRSRKQAALSTFLQTSEARKAVQTSLVAEVARGYYRLLMLDAQMAIAKRNLALNDSTLRMIHLQFDAGQVTALAIQQAEAQQMVAVQLMPQLEQEIGIQENALSVLTGHIPAAIARQGKLSEIAADDQFAVGFPSAMVSRRPDVRSAELALQIANANVGIAKASLYPSVTITASGGVNSFRASNWFNIPASLFGAVAGGLTQPILDRKRITTQVEVAKVEREKAVLQFRGTVLTAVAEVSDELIKTQKLKLQYDVAGSRVRTLQTAVKNSSMLFKNGMANYLEVITAQRNSLQGELDLAALRTAQLEAKVDLYRALGGGWK